jgi:phenylacetate-CoA ligase
LNWAGYRFGNRFADLTGHAPKINRFYEYNLFLNCLHFSTFDFQKDHVPLYLDKLRRFNPVLIKAYPSAIALFCRWMDELKVNSYHCDTVLTCAESLLDFQKATIKKVLHSYVYDFYNQNERAGLISTCEKESYHIHEEYSFVELLGNGSEINGQDDAKMIVTTTFHNYAMPLIRYQTDDLAKPTAKTGCECGRTYKTVKKIVGRINDLIVTPNGNHMSMPMGDMFDTALGVRQSQIVQECIDQLCVKIVKAQSFSQKDLDLIDYSLRERLGREMRIRYEFVDSITPGQNGKTKFIISKLGRQVFPASVPGASNC